VKELYIDGNHISHKGLAVMREGLSNNDKLVQLHIDSNPIGPMGSAELALIITNSSTLEQLHLYSCEIGRVGALAIAMGLSVNFSLKYLQLGANGVNSPPLRQSVVFRAKSHKARLSQPSRCHVTQRLRTRGLSRCQRRLRATQLWKLWSFRATASRIGVDLPWRQRCLETRRSRGLSLT